MANYSCSACEDLRETSPNFVVNGITDTECASLGNDTGLSPSSGNNDCTDLNNINDCLVGNMAEEVDAYDVCDWKEFMKKFIPNVWTTIKAIICSICGIWTYIHCLYTAIGNLVSALNATTQGQSFIRYYRDNSGTGQGYQWNITEDASHTLDIYKDCNIDNPGSQPADRDYVVIISNCTDISDTNKVGINLTYYSSSDTRSIDVIRKRQAQHPDIDMNTTIDAFSWPCSGAVFIPKGAHIKVNAHVYKGDTGQFRLHQFQMSWIPVNVESSGIDISDILNC